MTEWRRGPRGIIALVLLVGALALTACSGPPPGTPLIAESVPRSGTLGPLTILPSNPRYFADREGRRAVYLTGSHTWNSVQDWDVSDRPRPFDYDAYLANLQRYGHNFIRLWSWEQATWVPWTEERVSITPTLYLRTGPGRALDGDLRFDLGRFNPEYFQRLRRRVEAARERGFYVSVMLFNGWSIEQKGQRAGNPWNGHPFNRANNINGIDGDANGDGEGKEVHTLLNPSVTALQKAYLTKVVDAVGDLDNVLWEISNESHPGATEWQYEMIRTVQGLEAHRGQRHPVGMSSMFPTGEKGNTPLFEGPADWVAPHASETDRYRDDPPAAAPGKVVLSDTDHLWGIGGNPRWVWKSLLRGLNPIFMDPYEMRLQRIYPAWPVRSAPAPEWDDLRRALGYARAVADRVDLAALTPEGRLASSGLCLAAPGREYLVLVPFPGGRLRRLAGLVLPGLVAGSVQVDLSAAQGPLGAEWIDVERGRILPADPVAGAQRLEIRAPFLGDAILHLTTARRPGEGEDRGAPAAASPAAKIDAASARPRSR